jgi:CRP/FNR family cyclic AMP-dependent transcriptional regulator
MQSMEVADELARLALFADLTGPQLQGVAHTFDERWFEEGARILRQDLTGSGFYIILDGDVAIRQDGRDLATLGRGDFFGEISALLGLPPVADVVALRPVRCLHLAASALQDFLLAYPAVMFRMLLDQTRRVQGANRWRG